MNMNRSQSKRKGSAMALMLLAVVVLSVMGVGLLSLGLRGRTIAIRNTSKIAARCAADAGLTKAVFEMNEKLKVKPWDGSTLPQATNETLPNFNATFSYTITGDANNYTIEATGTDGIATKTVRSTLSLKGPFNDVLFVKDSLSLTSGTIVDGYNSKAGSYGGTNSLNNITIGTNTTANAALQFSKADTIYGDVTVGVGADPVEAVVTGAGKITGSLSAAIESRELPATVPPALPSKGNLKAKGGTVVLTSADSGAYKKIKLEHGATLAIGANEDVVLRVTENFKVEHAGGKIEIREGGSLTLYFDSAAGGGGCGGHCGKSVPFINFDNLTQSAANLQIYANFTGDFKFGSTGDFYGTVYAPKADLYMSSGDDIYGAFTGNTITQQTTGNIHYDEALKTAGAGINDKWSRFYIQRWEEE